MPGKHILMIVGGGIAAYKACDLIRTLRRGGGTVTCVLTDGGARFVTAMTLAALSERPVHTSLWDLDEAEMGHIQLSRQADLIVVVPATADLLARMAAGIADDLATTLLLATDKPVLVAPAMNVRMWLHPATRRNVAVLRADGIMVVPPDEGAMACGEYGPGRLPAVDRLSDLILTRLAGPTVDGPDAGSLVGRAMLVTAGPTHEPIDPVRYIANRSSGKQGFAIAAALARRGGRVTLIAGPVALPTPAGVDRIDVVTARDMAAAVDRALPVDVAILVAAVADWHVLPSPRKIRKLRDGTPELMLRENPDILATLGTGPRRPALLIGFAAETEDVVANASAKRARKGADWIVANDVSGDVLGGDRNHVQLVTAAGWEDWPDATKAVVAERLAARIADHFA